MSRKVSYFKLKSHEKVYQTSAFYDEWKENGFQAKIYGQDCSESHRPDFLLPESANPWLRIILASGDRITISGIIEEAKKNGIEYKTIHDAGRTEIEAGSLTVLSLGPEFEEKLENLCSFLPIIEWIAL